jgi:hypothetical protein
MEEAFGFATGSLDTYKFKLKSRSAEEWLRSLERS